jgi:hypothetical protein
MADAGVVGGPGAVVEGTADTAPAGGRGGDGGVGGCLVPPLGRPGGWAGRGVRVLRPGGRLLIAERLARPRGWFRGHALTWEQGQELVAQVERAGFAEVSAVATSSAAMGCWPSRRSGRRARRTRCARPAGAAGGGRRRWRRGRWPAPRGRGDGGPAAAGASGSAWMALTTSGRRAVRPGRPGR